MPSRRCASSVEWSTSCSALSGGSTFGTRPASMAKGGKRPPAIMGRSVRRKTDLNPKPNAPVSPTKWLCLPVAMVSSM